jgi:pilus assembly protein CpaB
MRRKLRLRDLGQRPLLLAAGLVAIGLVAAFAGPWDHRAPSASSAVSPKSKPVLVFAAARALSQGSRLRADDLVSKPVSAPLAATAVTSPTEIVGRVTARRFAAGETIARDGLRDAVTLGISAHVPEGERAFAIHVGEDDIVGGFLQSGDHVDVIATIPGSVFPSKSAADVPDRSRTVLLLQNIAVLAVGENPSTRGSIQSGARTVSLALSPQDLARLALAQRYGKVSLAIRMPGDNAVVRPVLAVLGDLAPSASSDTPKTSMPKTSAPTRHIRTVGIPFYAGTRAGALSLGSPR